ncbi:hypothetical protein [Mycobacterium lepromatosis]|uniref:hypothetical protein n=1 Tax=Mycobacterium lepromatosis TaxID=480418 RepID=UPI000A45BC02|nr:hypothetical protein [Mycobacterium lepromatosis]
MSPAVKISARFGNHSRIARTYRSQLEVNSWLIRNAATHSTVNTSTTSTTYASVSEQHKSR